jgi:hypothetical protein
MSNTDFFDDDLVKRTPAPGAGPVPGAAGAEDARASGSRDLNLTRMSRHRDQLEAQVAQTMQEIERLRQKQEDFENDKRRLEELRRKQDEYVRGKREIQQRLNQSLLSLEREEVRATQMAELVGSTRRNFKAMLEEVERIDESAWHDDGLHEDLAKAQDLISSIRLECEKSLAKLETFAPVSSALPETGSRGLSAPPERPLPSFGYLILAGIAMGVPLSLLVGGVSLLIYWIVKGAAF